jgi:hypothetical protein
MFEDQEKDDINAKGFIETTRALIQLRLYIFGYIYMYIYIHMCG